MWQYNKSNYDPNKTFGSIIPEGTHKVMIDQAEPRQAKSGRDMIAFTMRVSGHSGKLFHNLVNMEDRPEITDQNIGMMLACFNVPDEMAVSFPAWVGKMGGVVVKHEQGQDGRTRATIAEFLTREKAIAAGLTFSDASTAVPSAF